MWEVWCKYNDMYASLSLIWITYPSNKEKWENIIKQIKKIKTFCIIHNFLMHGGAEKQIKPIFGSLQKFIQILS